MDWDDGKEEGCLSVVGVRVVDVDVCDWKACFGWGHLNDGAREPLIAAANGRQLKIKFGLGRSVPKEKGRKGM